MAAANAGLIGAGHYSSLAVPVPLAYASAPIAKQAVLTKTVATEYDPHPEFNYSYDVQESLIKEPATLAVKHVEAAPIVYSAPSVVQPIVKAAVVKTVVPAETTISKYSTGFTHHAPVVHTVAQPVVHTVAQQVVQPIVESAVVKTVVPAETTISKYSTGFTHHAPVYSHVSAPVVAAWWIM